jgi:hypothetical protein
VKSKNGQEGQEGAKDKRVLLAPFCPKTASLSQSTKKNELTLPVSQGADPSADNNSTKPEE